MPQLKDNPASGLDSLAEPKMQPQIMNELSNVIGMGDGNGQNFDLSSQIALPHSR